jgi:hypothetical protein
MCYLFIYLFSVDCTILQIQYVQCTIAVFRSERYHYLKMGPTGEPPYEGQIVFCEIIFWFFFQHV